MTKIYESTAHPQNPHSTMGVENGGALGENASGADDLVTAGRDAPAGRLYGDGEKFRNRYRIPSARLPGYDYASDGAYFVTICTANREPFFGQITDGEMRLSEMGKIVADEWAKTAEIRGNVELGAWVVMPNHFHAVVVIANDDDGVRNDDDGVRNDDDGVPNDDDGVPNDDDGVETPRRGVSTGNHKPQWKSGCLGAIVNQFKSKCTKRIREFSPDFAWQPRFHDHIIRDENEYTRISQYIIANPQNWKTDIFFHSPEFGGITC